MGTMIWWLERKLQHFVDAVGGWCRDAPLYMHAAATLLAALRGMGQQQQGLQLPHLLSLTASVSNSWTWLSSMLKGISFFWRIFISPNLQILRENNMGLIGSHGI